MTALPARPWWSFAPNPPCPDFCEETHEDGEFSNGGGMACGKTIAKTEHFEVGINQYHGCETAVPGVIMTDPVEVYVWAPALHDSYLTPDEAERMVAELNLAAAQAIREAREANR